MCGHAILALTRLVAETGLVAPDREDIVFNVPCGRIVARPHWQGGKVAAASFRNVPSYVALAGASVDVPGIGPVAFDIAYGGALLRAGRGQRRSASPSNRPITTG